MLSRTKRELAGSMADVGHAVVTLSGVEQTLEEVYLRVVGNAPKRKSDA